MATRYDENTKARAVPLVREHRDDYDGVRQAEVDAGEAAGVSSDERRELGELRRRCRELEPTIVILGGVGCLAA